MCELCKLAKRLRLHLTRVRKPRKAFITGTRQGLWFQVELHVRIGSRLMDVRTGPTASHPYWCHRQGERGEFEQKSSHKNDRLATRSGRTEAS